MKENKFVLALLLSSLFIAFLGIGLVVPVFPELMDEMGISGTTVGYLTAAFAFAQFIVSPFTGKAVDQYGRKIILVIGLFIFGFSEFLFGISRVVESLFVSRLLGGISAAFIMPAVTAFIADISSLESRPKALGYMSAAISTGFIIGPGVGGFLAEISIRVPFYFAGILGTLAGLLAVIFLKEPTRQADEHQQEAIGLLSTLKKITAAKYLPAVIVIFISTFGLVSFESFFGLFVDHKFQYTPKDIAYILTGSAILGVIAQVLLFEKIVDRIGEKAVIGLSLLISGIFVIVTTFVNGFVAIFVLTVLIFVGFDLFRPAVSTYLSRVADNEQGFAGGMNSMFTSLATIFGPIIGGWLFDIDIHYSYYFTAILLLLGAVITVIWANYANRSKQTETSHFVKY